MNRFMKMSRLPELPIHILSIEELRMIDTNITFGFTRRNLNQNPRAMEEFSLKKKKKKKTFKQLFTRVPIRKDLTLLINVLRLCFERFLNVCFQRSTLSLLNYLRGILLPPALERLVYNLKTKGNWNNSCNKTSRYSRQKLLILSRRQKYVRITYNW